MLRWISGTNSPAPGSYRKTQYKHPKGARALHTGGRTIRKEAKGELQTEISNMQPRQKEVKREMPLLDMLAMRITHIQGICQH